MTPFVHPYLLGGLALLSVPILIHLVTREKPKHLRFPAFRFLLQKFHTNRRKIRLHQLLLLLLRMLVIAAICFALAKPRITGDALPFPTQTQAVDVVFLFDTSSSMGYERTERREEISRLKDARRSVLGYLGRLPEDSRIAVLDSGNPGGRFTNAALAEERINSLEIRHGNIPVSRMLRAALDLFTSDAKAETEEGPPPRFVFVFSDRTKPSWEAADLRGVTVPEDIRVTYVDVGIDKPIDLAIEQVVVDPPGVTFGGTVNIRAIVRATGGGGERTLSCQIDNDAQVQTLPVKLAAGERRAYSFAYSAAKSEERAKAGDGLGTGPHQVVLKLDGEDGESLKFNNSAYATFLIQKGHRVLTIVDREERYKFPFPWPYALQSLGYESSVMTAEAVVNDKAKLASFHVICLHEVEDPDKLWPLLHDEVARGKRLVVIPAGQGMSREAYNSRAASQLLPARFDKAPVLTDEFGIPWNWRLEDNESRLLKPFLTWRREQSGIEFQKAGGEPRAYQYWPVTPIENSKAIVRFADGKDNPPILLERFVGAGHVLMFTTTLNLEDDVQFPNIERRSWQNYWKNSFGFVLVDKVCRYLAGDSVTVDWNLLCGQTVTLPLSRDAGEKFLLRGTNLPQQGLPLSVATTGAEDRDRVNRSLPVSGAVKPGNYKVFALRDQGEEILEGFSLNVPAAESLLDPRLDKTDIEATLGEGSVLELGQNKDLLEALDSRKRPFELWWVLMLALLVVLAVENLVANRRREGTAPPEAASVIPTPSSLNWRPAALIALWTSLGLVLGVLLSLLGEGLSASSALSILCLGLLGFAHGLIAFARFPSRDGAIFGGLLGSMVGVLYGWLVMADPEELDSRFEVLTAMILGAAILAADGWLHGLRKTAAPVKKLAERASEKA